jgi:hypothetical protein
MSAVRARAAPESCSMDETHLTRARWMARAEIAVAVVMILVVLSTVIVAPTLMFDPGRGDDGSPAWADVVVAACYGLMLARFVWMIRMWRHNPEDGAPAWRYRERSRSNRPWAPVRVPPSDRS